MIIISGATGSGKTTVAKELDEIGFTVIPTFTTRPPRENDDYTVCVSEEQFRSIDRAALFMATGTFNSKMGQVSYGIPIEPYLTRHSEAVAILVQEYMDDTIKYISENTDDMLLRVYLEVDEETLINNSMKDNSRGKSNLDLKDRIARDREKNKVLRDQADIIIVNDDFLLSPKEIAEIIIDEYKRRRKE